MVSFARNRELEVGEQVIVHKKEVDTGVGIAIEVHACVMPCIMFGIWVATREKRLFWLFGGGDRLGLRCQIIYL